MRRSRSTFAEAWRAEFDRLSDGVEWAAITVPGRARILNQFREKAMQGASLRARTREVLRCGPRDLESIERRFSRRAHRLGVSRADLRQFS